MAWGTLLHIPLSFGSHKNPVKELFYRWRHWGWVALWSCLRLQAGEVSEQSTIQVFWCGILSPVLYATLPPHTQTSCPSLESQLYSAALRKTSGYNQRSNQFTLWEGRVGTVRAVLNLLEPLTPFWGMSSFWKRVFCIMAPLQLSTMCIVFHRCMYIRDSVCVLFGYFGESEEERIGTLLITRFQTFIFY